MATEDKREYIRLETSRPVEFTVQRRTYYGSIENIGSGGVFVKTSQTFSIGQEISMSFPSPPFEKEDRTGTIVDINPKGFRVKFNHPGYAR